MVRWEMEALYRFFDFVSLNGFWGIVGAKWRSLELGCGKFMRKSLVLELAARAFSEFSVGFKYSSMADRF